jgi:Flp pilus assembly protein TadD
VRRGRAILLTLALAAATAAVFRGVASHEFVAWDDSLNVVENARLNPPTRDAVARFWREPYLGLYIPLTYTAWSGVAWAAGGAASARPFHLANLAVHCAAAAVVFALLRRVGATDGPALAGALVFAIHPLQTEPVAWVTGLKDLLGGLLSLAAVWRYVAFAGSGDAGAGASAVAGVGDAARAAAAPRRRALAYAGATALFLLALFAKPSAVAVPLVAWCLDRWLLQRPLRATLAPIAPWAGVAAAWALLTSSVQPPAESGFVAPLWARPLVAADALTFYLRKLVWPAPLGIDYGRSPRVVIEEGGLAGALLAAAAVAALGLLAWRARRHAPWLFAACAAFVAALAPVLGLAPFAFQEYSTVADRYAYVAMLAPAIAVAWGASRLQPALAAALLAPALALLGARAAAQAATWRDSTTLFEHAVAVNPRSWLGHTQYGSALVREGRVDEGIAHCLEALRLHPEFSDAHYNLGLAQMERGRTADAERSFAAAARRQPAFARAHNNLGVALSRGGRRDEAVAAFRDALAVDPGNPEAHTNLGNVLLREGRLAEARAEYERALAAAPDAPEALSNLGVVLSREGRVAEGVAAFERALRARPDFGEVHANLAVALATLGRRDEALAHFEAALRIDPENREARQNHARLLDAMGRGSAGVSRGSGLE